MLLEMEMPPSHSLHWILQVAKPPFEVLRLVSLPENSFLVFLNMRLHT